MSRGGAAGVARRSETPRPDAEARGTHLDVGEFSNRGKPVNRKLIRPNLSDLKDQLNSKLSTRPRKVPQEQTNAESFYYLKQMNNKTPMVVVLQDGEEIRGVIEWYDKNCLKLNRTDLPNLLLLKHNIKYLYKESEETSRPSSSDD